MMLKKVNSDEIYVGRKVYIKPGEYQRPKYSDDFVPTEITWVGRKNFKVRDSVKPDSKYHIHNLKECIGRINNNIILLELPREEDLRKNKLIIKVRKYFNSRAIQEESEENLEKVIELLGL